jgi:hypothetical protein
VRGLIFYQQGNYHDALSNFERALAGEEPVFWIDEAYMLAQHSQKI